MIDFFLSGGPMMWLFLVIALLIIFLTIKKALQLFGNQDLPPAVLENGTNAIIFWGSISVILGFFAHYLGLYHAMQAIYRANDISPAIVAFGYSLSLVTILTGLILFVISAIIWFVFRWRIKQITTRSA
jgi:biopolymer transport protein ExbB/TolQ